MPDGRGQISPKSQLTNSKIRFHTNPRYIYNVKSNTLKLNRQQNGKTCREGRNKETTNNSELMGTTGNTGLNSQSWIGSTAFGRSCSSKIELWAARSKISS